MGPDISALNLQDADVEELELLGSSLADSSGQTAASSACLSVSWKISSFSLYAMTWTRLEYKLPPALLQSWVQRKYLGNMIDFFFLHGASFYYSSPSYKSHTWLTSLSFLHSQWCHSTAYFGEKVEFLSSYIYIHELVLKQLGKFYYKTLNFSFIFIIKYYRYENFAML